MIVNLNGEVVKTIDVKDISRIIDISTLTPGSYIMVYKNGEYYTQSMFVKIK